MKFGRQEYNPVTREFDPSSTIAMFIASALQHNNPRCNSPAMQPVSTIRVDQHKNKFGQVVVYCHLADTNMVNEFWARSKRATPEPDDDYRRTCLDHDAIHYRRTYLQMLFLAPQYKDITLVRADYGLLLHDDVKGLEADLEERLQTNPGNPANLLSNWRATSMDELRERLHKIYDRAGNGF